MYARSLDLISARSGRPTFGSMVFVRFFRVQLNVQKTEISQIAFQLIVIIANDESIQMTVWLSSTLLHGRLVYFRRISCRFNCLRIKIDARRAMADSLFALNTRVNALDQLVFYYRIFIDILEHI